MQTITPEALINLVKQTSTSSAMMPSAKEETKEEKKNNGRRMTIAPSVAQLNKLLKVSNALKPKEKKKKEEPATPTDLFNSKLKMRAI